MNETSRDEAKRWWLRCVSCSEAAFTQQNRAFGTEESDLEQAAGLFSGGFLHQGDACGLLQGAALAAGVEAERRFPDDEDRAAAAAIAASRVLARTYPEVAGSTNCREITELDFNKVTDRVEYMRSGKGRVCGRLSLEWVDRAHDLIDESLGGAAEAPRPCRSCVLDAARRLPALDTSDPVRIAGYSGGLGLSGNVCGVLAAGVFAMAARHYKGRGAQRRDSALVGALQETGFHLGLRKRANALRIAFEGRFGARTCAEVTGRRFQGIAEFSEFIANGGCSDVVDFVVEWVRDDT